MTRASLVPVLFALALGCATTHAGDPPAAPEAHKAGEASAAQTMTELEQRMQAADFPEGQMRVTERYVDFDAPQTACALPRQARPMPTGK